jgi:transcriptional regulator with XRE-family HTH domain
MERSSQIGPDERLARRLKALRTQAQWSLEELAKASGVSRATLSRIENHEVSPTAAVLGRLCAAYGLTMSRLLAQVEGAGDALVTRREQPVWTDPETRAQRRAVSPPSAEFECELVECWLPPDTRIHYAAPPRPGLEHHLYLQQGALELTIETRIHRLAPGDCIRWRLYGALTFRTLADEARYLLVVK